VNVTIHNDKGEVIQSVELSPLNGHYAVNIKAGEWHSLTCEEPNTVIMEVKEGPYIPHEIGGDTGTAGITEALSYGVMEKVKNILGVL
jgi:cupin fold WbuC family metalloprotein